MVREHLVEPGNEHQRKAGHGIIRPDEMLSLRWNSQFGSIFVDGSHFKVSLVVIFGNVITTAKHFSSLARAGTW